MKTGQGPRLQWVLLEGRHLQQLEYLEPWCSLHHLLKVLLVDLEQLQQSQFQALILEQQEPQAQEQEQKQQQVGLVVLQQADYSGPVAGFPGVQQNQQFEMELLQLVGELLVVPQ